MHRGGARFARAFRISLLHRSLGGRHQPAAAVPERLHRPGPEPLGLLRPDPHPYRDPPQKRPQGRRQHAPLRLPRHRGRRQPRDNARLAGGDDRPAREGDRRFDRLLERCDRRRGPEAQQRPDHREHQLRGGTRRDRGRGRRESVQGARRIFRRPSESHSCPYLPAPQAAPAVRRRPCRSRLVQGARKADQHKPPYILLL